MGRIGNERLKAILDICEGYVITLDNDPAVLGPSYLQSMIAKCRNYTNGVVTLMNELRNCRRELDMELRRNRAEFEILSNEHLSKNATVKALPSFKDREAQINLILRDERRTIVEMENDLLDLGHVEDMVKLRHHELKDSMREIQTQRQLIRDDVLSGGMYGDERLDKNKSKNASLEEANIDELLSGGLVESTVPEDTPLPLSEDAQEAADTSEETPEEYKVLSVEESTISAEEPKKPTVEATAEVLDINDEFAAFLDQSDTPKAETKETNTADDFSEFLANL